MRIEERPKREYRDPRKLESHPCQRELRPGGVEKLTERIYEDGYNPNKPLGIVIEDGKEYVVIGGHRLAALKEGLKKEEFDVDEVPVLIYENTDPVKLAKRDNQDEDTYNPEDLFDNLDLIEYLKHQGKPQTEIGEQLGWSRSKVKQYQAINKKIGTEILDLAKTHQKGRVPKNGTNVPFNFTEGWFRNSGIYDLNGKYQKQVMKDFISSKCKWSKTKLKKEVDKYKDWQEYLNIAENELHNEKYLDNVRDLIEENTFKTEKSLRKKIEDFNQKSKNKLINGDALNILQEEIDDEEIDIVITDPPYGINYISNRSKYDDHITKEGVENDEDIDEALTLIQKTLEILLDKTKMEAHFYIFTSWKIYPHLLKRIPDQLDVKNLIIWDKNNHGAGDLEGAWGNRHEMIVFASKSNKKLKQRKQDIIQVGKMPSNKMITPTQKPQKLITKLLEASVHEKDTICDPFMGSGSTIKAVKDFKEKLNYIGIEIDGDIFEKAKAFINR